MWLINFLKKLFGGKDTSLSVSRCFGAMGRFVQKSSAMGPLILIVLFVTVAYVVVLFAGLKLSSVAAIILATVLYVLIVFAAVGAYYYLMIKHPDLLRSEEYWDSFNQKMIEAAIKGLPVDFCGDCRNDVIDVESVRMKKGDHKQLMELIDQDPKALTETMAENTAAEDKA